MISFVEVSYTYRERRKKITATCFFWILTEVISEVNIEIVIYILKRKEVIVSWMKYALIVQEQTIRKTSIQLFQQKYFYRIYVWISDFSAEQSLIIDSSLLLCW